MAFALVLAAAGAPSEPWQSQSLHPEPLRLAAFGPQPLPLYAHSLASGEIRQRPPSPERPGAELASLCPGRESTVLHYREASRESGSVRQDSNSPTTPHRDA